MDRVMLLDHLAQADGHVAQAERHLIEQRKLIDQLERDGHDTVAALDLLRTMEESLAAHIADRDRIRGEIAHAR